MQNSVQTVFYGVLVAVAGATPAFADSARSAAAPLGYQDPETGILRPLRAVVPDATTNPTNGTVKVTFNVKLVTVFPKGTELLCQTNITGSVISATTGTSQTFEESEDEAVTLSAATATCTTIIPYSWVLSTSGGVSESFLGSYTLLATTKTSTGTIPATGLINRSSTGFFVSSKTIPAAGSTSTYTVNVTL